MRGTSAQLKIQPGPEPPEGKRVCHVHDMCILLRKGTKGLELGKECGSGDSSVRRWSPYYKAKVGRALGESTHKAIWVGRGSLLGRGAPSMLCSPPTYKVILHYVVRIHSGVETQCCFDFFELKLAGWTERSASQSLPSHVTRAPTWWSLAARCTRMLSVCPCREGV